MRVAKALASVASRRSAEKFIQDGRVSVNGSTIFSPVFFVKESDLILFDGKPLPVTTPRLWKFFKPRSVLTSSTDSFGRSTLFSLLPESLGRVISVGRLDYNTEGLILITNNGELARALEIPCNDVKRTYICRAYGEVPASFYMSLINGVTVSDIKYKPIKIKFLKRQGANNWFKLILREGKNREIRKIFEHFGLKVNRLIRLSFGPFTLDDMTSKELRPINQRELDKYIQNLKYKNL